SYVLQIQGIMHDAQPSECLLQEIWMKTRDIKTVDSANLTEEIQEAPTKVVQPSASSQPSQPSQPTRQRAPRASHKTAPKVEEVAQQKPAIAEPAVAVEQQSPYVAPSHKATVEQNKVSEFAK